jgi:ribosomal protein S18 acetylase RimI-like enzyme
MNIYETLENGIIIAEYEDSMATTLADMWNRSSEDWGGHGGMKTAGQIISRHTGAAFFNIYVAFDGTEAVGYCSLSRYGWDADTLYIPLLGVRSDYQGRKIGKALVLRCVQRTIELGYTRLDLFTWSGNIEAVPLYKKCGFFWEDRGQSTHLVNFIPGILQTKLFQSFFEKADWYVDSTRKIEIVPDGAKVNKFELFEYGWEKDGACLAIGFERSGRRIRYIETNDFRVEMMAVEHELAFGLIYDSVFTVVNKSGKDLHVKISGREDKNIRFDFELDTQVVEKEEFHGKFFVEQILEPLDSWQVYPCLLADVWINGQLVTFGLGIETKFPLWIELKDDSQVKQVGMEVESYLNVRSSLIDDVDVRLYFPDNDTIGFDKKMLEISLPSKGKTSIPITAKILDIGYAALPVRYEIVLRGGTMFSFEKPLFVCHRNLVESFSGEDDFFHYIVNGAWQLCLCKNDNITEIRHLTHIDYNTEMFQPPKLGLPYNDEFNLIKSNVKMYHQGTEMILEAEMVSGRFQGLVVKQIISLSASGVVSRYYVVKNISEHSRDVMLSDIYMFHLGENTKYAQKGCITTNHDSPKPNGLHYGVCNVEPDDLTENWIFEDGVRHTRGYCWSPDLKPTFMWGYYFTFEINVGELGAGKEFVTQPVSGFLGLFDNYRDFRNYALKRYEKADLMAIQRVEVKLNAGNPFVTTSNQIVSLEVINNRETDFEGEISIYSEIFETQSIVNPPDEIIRSNKFEMMLQTSTSPIEMVRLSMKMADYEKEYARVLFYSSGQISCVQEGSVYSVSNGSVTLKVDPKFGHICYSLIDKKGQEWLHSQYPHHLPFAWWNIYLGGIMFTPTNMSVQSVLRESIKADFVEISDNFGNLWSGIRVTLTITEDDELRGSVYEFYYVTMPGLPLLCSFYRYKNGTGLYRKEWQYTTAHLNITEDKKGVYMDFKNKHQQQYRLRMGSTSQETGFENVVKLSGTRTEKMYYFQGTKDSGRYNSVEGDTKHPVYIYTSMEVRVEHLEEFTSIPVFYIVSEMDLPDGALDDLERVRF